MADCDSSATLAVSRMQRIRSPSLSMPQSLMPFPETSRMPLDAVMSTTKSWTCPARKKRHVVDVLGTIYWSNRLATSSPDGSLAWFACELPELRTPIVERVGSNSRVGQLRAYQRGLRVPSPQVVEALAQFDELSFTVFYHPLWTVLKMDLPLAKVQFIRIGADSCQRDWNSFDRAVAQRPGASVRPCPSGRGGWPKGTRAAHTLLRQASLDLLAEMTLAFRVEPGLGSYCRMRDTLLALAPIMATMGIAQPLADYVDELALSVLGAADYPRQLRLKGYFEAAERGARLITHLAGIEGPLRPGDQAVAAYWAAIQGGPLDLELSMADIRHLTRYRSSQGIGSVFRKEYRHQQ